MVVYRHNRGSSLFNDIALLLIINPMRIILLFLLFFLLVIESSAQCSMCRAVLESAEAKETAKGINNGIIYLMAIPYLLVGFVGYQIFKLLKNND